MRGKEQLLEQPFLAFSIYLYGCTKNMILLSFIPIKYMAVIFFSSIHNSEFRDRGNDKSEIDSFYNTTKSGGDTLDYMCSIYSTNRNTRRWSLVIFYHLISLGCSNSHVLFSKMHSTTKSDLISPTKSDSALSEDTWRLDSTYQICLRN